MQLTENLHHQINELEAEVARLATRESDLFTENTWLRNDRQLLVAEVGRLAAKCNRMARSAAVEDIHGLAQAVAVEGGGVR